MKNPDTTQGQPQVGTTALFAFLRGKMSDQKAKAAQKRREQRDADITASMHEEFSYVIDDIIDKVKALEEEWAAKMEKANVRVQPQLGAAGNSNEAKEVES